MVLVADIMHGCCPSNKMHLQLQPKKTKILMHFASRATPMHHIDGKGHKLELKSNRNYLINHMRWTLAHICTKHAYISA